MDNYNTEVKALLKESPDAIISIATNEASSGLIKELRKNSSIPVATISHTEANVIKLLLSNETSFENIYSTQIKSTHEYDLEQFKTITKKEYDPLIYEGYQNTLALAELLSSYNASELTTNYEHIKKQLPAKAITLLTTEQNNWKEVSE